MSTDLDFGPPNAPHNTRSVGASQFNAFGDIRDHFFFQTQFVLIFFCVEALDMQTANPKEALRGLAYHQWQIYWLKMFMNFLRGTV
jgi:hypothetical protein